MSRVDAKEEGVRFKLGDKPLGQANVMSHALVLGRPPKTASSSPVR